MSLLVAQPLLLVTFPKCLPSTCGNQCSGQDESISAAQPTDQRTGHKSTGHIDLVGRAIWVFTCFQSNPDSTSELEKWLDQSKSIEMNGWHTLDGWIPAPVDKQLIPIVYRVLYISGGTKFRAWSGWKRSIVTMMIVYYNLFVSWVSVSQFLSQWFSSPLSWISTQVVDVFRRVIPNVTNESQPCHPIPL